MSHPPLLEFIKRQRALGKSDSDIKSALSAAGWQERDIEITFDASQAPVPPTQSAAMPPPSSPDPFQNIPGMRLPSPSSLLSQSWAQFRARMWTLIGIYLLPPAAVIFGTIVVIGAWALVNKLTGGNIFLNIFCGLLFLALYVGMIYLSIWSQVALLFAVKDGAENISLKESFKRARPYLLAFFWVGLLSGVIVMGGFLLFFIPGIFLAIWFSFAVWTVVAENQKGMDALLRSREYVRGYAWAIIGRMLFFGLIVAGVSVVCSIIASIVRLPAVASVFNSVFTVFIAPLGFVYQYNIFSALRQVKPEMASLQARGKKWPYILIGWLGLLLIPIFLAAAIFFSLNVVGVKTRDAKRVADVGRLASALELYLFDQEEYPEDLMILAKEGYYDGESLPAAPQPPDGKCTSELNDYRYQKFADGSYELRFCLGSATDKYTAGEQVITKHPKDIFDLYPDKARELESNLGDPKNFNPGINPDGTQEL